MNFVPGRNQHLVISAQNLSCEPAPGGLPASLARIGPCIMHLQSMRRDA